MTEKKFKSSTEIFESMSPACRKAFHEHEFGYAGGLGGGRGTAIRAFKAAWDSSQALGQDLAMRYLGVLTLMGRIAGSLPRQHEDQYGLDRAYKEANIFLEMRGSPLRFARASGNGWGAFEPPFRPDTDTAAPAPEPAAKAERICTCLSPITADDTRSPSCLRCGGIVEPERLADRVADIIDAASPTADPPLRWEALPYKRAPAGAFVDVPGGRLALQRAKPRSRAFVGTWNGVHVGSWASLDAGKGAMERRYRQGRLPKAPPRGGKP